MKKWPIVGLLLSMAKKEKKDSSLRSTSSLPSIFSPLFLLLSLTSCSFSCFLLFSLTEAFFFKPCKLSVLSVCSRNGSCCLFLSLSLSLLQFSFSICGGERIFSFFSLFFHPRRTQEKKENERMKVWEKAK